MAPRDPSPRALGFRMPAEWEPHAATWLAWPHNQDDWPGKFELIPKVFVEMATHLSRVERVRFVVDAVHRTEVERLLRESGADLSRIDLFEARTDRSWTRDFLPLFVKREEEVAAVKFRFDGWARYDNHALDDAAGHAIATASGNRVWEARAADPDGVFRPVVLEGGAIDVDGEGTLLASEDCLVTGPHGRNPWLGTTGTETVLSEYLGVDRVLWVGDGVAGDDTSGHVDDFVRFAGPGRVVIAEETRGSDPNHRALRAARERLEGARDAQGRRLEIVTLPMPAPILWGEERLPASYANYYVANELVLVPTFDDPSDARALGILGELFPTRRVVGIRAVDLVLGLGTVHCSTHEEPAARANRGSTTR